MALLTKGVSEVMQELLKDVEAYVEEALQVYPPWVLVAGTIVSTLAFIRAQSLYVNRHKVLTALKKRLFRLIRSLPGIQQRIQRELAAAKDDLEKDFFKNAGSSSFNELPVKGWSEENVLEASKDILSQSPFAWQEGKVSAGTYSGSDAAHTDLLQKVYHHAAWTNPLHADIFPGVRKMEAEIVRMTINTFKGGDTVCGCLTSGGSESILMALKAYRDWARNVRGIIEPNIVAGISIHAGFDKAAVLLNMRLIKVRLNPRTLQVDVEAMRKAMDANTIVLACSAPEYAHGIVDDIEAVGALGASKGVGVHVDCCMGGYLLPFMEKAGYPISPFDFTVNGVTSISADTHKYGSSPKGSSVVMYRDAELRRYQYFVTPDWPGGIYASPTIPGSRPGGLVAVCWASLLYHGVEGYVKKTRNIISTARSIKQGLADIPELFLFGDPQTSILAVGSDVVNIYSVLEALTAKGWHLMAVQNPPGLMMCVTSLQCKEGLVEELLCDIKESVKFVKENPLAPQGQIGKVYGAAASIPDKDLVSDCAKLFLDAYYQTGPSEIAQEPKKRETEREKPLGCKAEGNVEESGTSEGKDEVKEEKVFPKIMKQEITNENAVKEVMPEETGKVLQGEVVKEEAPEEVEGVADVKDEMTAEEEKTTGEGLIMEVKTSEGILVEELTDEDVKREVAEDVAKEDSPEDLEQKDSDEVIKEEEILEEGVKEELAQEVFAEEELAKVEVVKEEPAKEEIVNEELVKKEIMKEELGKGEDTKEELAKEKVVEEELAEEKVVEEELTEEEVVKKEPAKEEVRKEEPAKEEVVKEYGRERIPKPASIAA